MTIWIETIYYQGAGETAPVKIRVDEIVYVREGRNKSPLTADGCYIQLKDGIGMSIDESYAAFMTRLEAITGP